MRRLTENIGAPIIAYMDWTSIISDLARAGYTQAAIASACGCTQPTISDIANGKTERPTWDVGSALVRLHSDVCQKKSSHA